MYSIVLTFVVVLEYGSVVVLPPFDGEGGGGVSFTALVAGNHLYFFFLIEIDICSSNQYSYLYLLVSRFKQIL